jgi:hypothetical protein
LEIDRVHAAEEHPGEIGVGNDIFGMEAQSLDDIGDLIPVCVRIKRKGTPSIMVN